MLKSIQHAAALAVLLVTVLTASSSQPRQASGSRSKVQKRRAHICTHCKVTIIVSSRKLDERSHDALEDFDQAELSVIPRWQLLDFLKQEAPADLAVFVVRLEEVKADLLKRTRNRNMIKIELTNMPEVFALFVLDLDGSGLIHSGEFHS